MMCTWRCQLTEYDVSGAISKQALAAKLSLDFDPGTVYPALKLLQQGPNGRLVRLTDLDAAPTKIMLRASRPC